jgi:predicted Zn-dependent peptidase
MAVTFEHRTLDNGLEIIAEVDPSAHSAAAGFFVKTGARDEQSPVMGVSHYLEHMMFKGTPRRSAEDINRAFDELGARNNAYTTSEMTCFHAQVLPECLPSVLDVLTDMMRPALRQDDFDTEKGVILEEIAMYKDNPFWVLYEATVEKHYADHPLSHRVLGTSETVSALTRDQMQAYFDQRYSADNTVLALAGRVDIDATARQAEQLCGSWQQTGATRDNATPDRGDGALTLHDEKVMRAYMLMLTPAPPVGDDARYAATLLAQVLGAGGNSRLHWALIETGLAEEAQAAYDPHDGVGEYFVYASGDPARADEIWAVVEREIDSLVESVTADDLARLRARLATGVTVGGERPADRMQRIGRRWLAMGTYATLEDELDRINRVTLDEVRAVFTRYPMVPRTVGRLLPA